MLGYNSNALDKTSLKLPFPTPANTLFSIVRKVELFVHPSHAYGKKTELNVCTVFLTVNLERLANKEQTKPFHATITARAITATYTYK